MRNEKYTLSTHHIILDFSKCKTYGDLYNVISAAFDFPDFFGKNLDALWDCMKDYCEKGTQVIIKGSKLIPSTLKDTFAEILEVFNNVHKRMPSITFEIIS